MIAQVSALSVANDDDPVGCGKCGVDSQVDFSGDLGYFRVVCGGHTYIADKVFLRNMVVDARRARPIRVHSRETRLQQGQNNDQGEYNAVCYSDKVFMA